MTMRSKDWLGLIENSYGATSRMEQGHLAPVTLDQPRREVEGWRCRSDRSTGTTIWVNIGGTPHSLPRRGLATGSSPQGLAPPSSSPPLGDC